MRHVVMYSGGASSWVTASRVCAEIAECPTLLFCDTGIEDGDLYRFLIEGAAALNSSAISEHTRRLLIGLPPVSSVKDVSILRDRRNGSVAPLTLSAFRARIAKSAPVDETDIGGCGCFVTGDDHGSEDGTSGSSDPAHQPRDR